MKYRILITGGSGFIGTNLVEFFLVRGCTVKNLDVSPPRNASHIDYWESVDLLDAGSLADKVKNFSPDYVFHLAARTDLNGSSLDDYPENTVGVANIIEALRELPKLKKVIFFSSRLVCKIGYSPASEFDFFPTTKYGESKVAGENIVREKMKGISVSYCIVRPTSIWGPWFDVPYKDFFTAVSNGKYVHPLNRKIRKSFGYVGNTIHQLNSLMNSDDKSINAKVFYLADYPEIEVSEFANCIRRGLGKSRIKEVPMCALRLLAKIGDLLKIFGWKNPPLTSFRLNNLTTEMVYDLDELKSVVGDLPFSMSHGVKDTLQWLQHR